MLRFEKLWIQNFGPFEGEQVLDFTDQDGVIIIWGRNGTGKTKLLNAFRYALFGYVTTSNGKHADYLKLINNEAMKRGEYTFSVKLKMSNNGERYTLNRVVHPREGISKPSSNFDFIEDCSLKKGEDILENKDRDHELAQIMPPDIARFFLFDGELLQEYSTLLDEDSQDGEKIKKGIEQILGMPILKNAVMDIHALEKTYVTDQNEAAKNDKNTKEYAERVNLLQVEIQGHDNCIEQEEKELSALKAEQGKIDELMKETDAIRKIHEEIQAHDNTIERLKKEKESTISDVQERMKTAWKGMVSQSARKMTEKLNTRIDCYQRRKNAAVASRTTLDCLEETLERHRCKICDQDVSEDLAEELKLKIKKMRENTLGLSAEESEELRLLQNEVKDLQKFQNCNNDVLMYEINSLMEMDIKISAEENEREEKRKQEREYGNIDPNIYELNEKMRKCEKEIDKTREKIAEEKKRRDELIDSKNNINKKIIKISSNKNVQLADKRLEICQDIEDVFEKGIEQYQLRLKDKVQEDASKLFRQMSADKDYVGLCINDNYGLNIQHKSGELVLGRSAGYENIVALALIGALHKNAPMQGPVIMDSLFGRLDEVHRPNVTRILPQLSDQVIVLATRAEIDPQRTREILGGNIIQEYTLKHDESFQTEIAKGEY